MDHSDRYAFVEFVIADEAAFDRLATVVAELQKQKSGDITCDEDHWLPYFTASDLSEFWWPDDVEMELWNKFWFSTPLPDRHSPEMPATPWDFRSLIEAVLGGEYELIGVRRTGPSLARLEIDPYAYPYGGIDAARTLIRAFGHKIIGFDDGAGFIKDDPQRPRWHKDMPPFALKKAVS
ncbi:hypothetical protein [Flavisphingomonas formosensis]|uniref:hypothetical protein n=1 Tax=Flavisphingomonas formosensis TaxID=861534 RepID=UPI0018DF0CC3|nr:hypothetical protein [Sphingomonas formosensis]